MVSAVSVALRKNVHLALAGGSAADMQNFRSPLVCWSLVYSAIQALYILLALCLAVTSISESELLELTVSSFRSATFILFIFLKVHICL